jgi:hypothetical protein
MWQKKGFLEGWWGDRAGAYCEREKGRGGRERERGGREMGKEERGKIRSE